MSRFAAMAEVETQPDLTHEQRERLREMVEGWLKSNVGHTPNVVGLANLVRTQPERLTPKTRPEPPQPPRPRFQA
jgi:hypothetical protein